MTFGSKTCIVLGGRGFAGSAVCAQAEAAGFKTTAVGRDNYSESAGSSCDVLINADGNSRKYLAEKDPAADFELSTRSVLKSLMDFRFGIYVYISSIDVYPDKSDSSANRESAEIDLRRLSPYGFHKRMAEQLVLFYAPRRLIIRAGGMVGPGLWKNSVYDLLKGIPPRVHPDSEYQYLHTAELGRIIFRLLAAGAENEIFNVAGRGAISVREIAALIPGRALAPEQSGAPKERYEVNVEKVSAVAPPPETRETLACFIRDVLAGKEKIK